MTVPAVVYFVEAAADARTVDTLLTRVLDEAAPSPTAVPPSTSYRAIGLQGGEHGPPYVKWASLPALFEEVAPLFRATMRFGGGTYSLQAHKASAMAILHPVLRDADAIVLLVDADNDTGRLKQLRDGVQAPLPPQRRPAAGANIPSIACGVAVRKREAWHLNGFEPASPKERALFKQEQKRISLDPVREAHRLNGDSRNPQTSGRCAKRVLDVLVQGDRDREHACVAETDLDALRQRGKETGLTDFLSELSVVAARLRGDP